MHSASYRRRISKSSTRWQPHLATQIRTAGGLRSRLPRKLRPPEPINRGTTALDEAHCLGGTGRRGSRGSWHCAVCIGWRRHLQSRKGQLRRRGAWVDARPPKCICVQHLHGITNAGSSLPIIAITAVVSVWLWRSRGRRAASGAVLAPVLATAVYNGIKYAFARQRPLGAMLFHLVFYAFPSGHATVSAAGVVTLAYICWRERVLTGP